MSRLKLSSAAPSARQPGAPREREESQENLEEKAGAFCTPSDPFLGSPLLQGARLLQAREVDVVEAEGGEGKGRSVRLRKASENSEEADACYTERKPESGRGRRPRCRQGAGSQAELKRRSLCVTLDPAATKFPRSAPASPGS